MFLENVKLGAGPVRPALKRGDIAGMLMLFHLVVNVLNSADLSNAVEHLLRFGGQDRPAQRHSAIVRLNLQCARV
jgi:hypothetical protein